MEQNNIAKHIITGRVGESIAAQKLIDLGHVILERNYLRKYGEIDLITRNRCIVHFVEVKTVSYETVGLLSNSVSRETFRPEENVHSSKLKKLSRVIEVWIHQNNYRGEWQIDVAAVRIVSREKYAEVEMIENVILE